MSIRNSILKELGAVAFVGLALVATPVSSFAEDVESGIQTVEASGQPRESGEDASDVIGTTDVNHVVMDNAPAPDFNEATGSYANSWRYKEGYPIDGGAALFARTEPNTWTYKDGVWYCSNGTSVSGAKGMGVDVSQWQGEIDWAKAKQSGVSFALIRCGFGGDNRKQDDPTFLKNVRGCLDNGIPFGIYLYSYAWNTGDAQDEANHVLRLLRENGISPSKLSYPIYYDLEEQAGTDRPCVKDNGVLHYMSNDDLAAIAKTFCTTIESAGYQVGVYANLNWWNNYLTNSVFSQWSRWVAQYNYQCDYKGSFDIWQRMSKGSIPGIQGDVDVNFSYVDPTNLYPEQTTWNRIFGQHHFDTMQAISKAGWTSADSVVIATDATYWDALAASALAGAHDAPILLTSGGSLSSQAVSEIKRLGAKTAYICGGPIAISAAVDDQVKAAGANAVRVYGQDQQGTARAISDAVSKVAKSDTCIVATARGFQDALSASPFAFAKKSPIFLCETGSNTLSQATLDAIRRGGYKRAIIVGGPIAVAADVDGKLGGIGVASFRKFGQTEYETSLEIAKWELSEGMTVSKMALATGTGYYDALSGAALCGRNNSVLVIASDYNRVCITDLIGRNQGAVVQGFVLGGEIAISQSTWNALLRSYFD